MKKDYSEMYNEFKEKVEKQLMKNLKGNYFFGLLKIN